MMTVYNTFKCKMCGGDIKAAEGAAFGTCDSCGTTSTLPKASDGRLVNLFNRANHFRRLNEFDKALTAYENILNENNADAEAHWCAALCRYGIEYVEDPRTHERVPTCHRVQYVSILTDADYLAALEFASDNYTRGLYETEARKISEIQKGILAVSEREAPFDVFICYKETTDGGSRTKDSVLAQDIYHQLKDDYRVFFSKITLEDKLGQEYEPYIFAALNSARVMLVIGSKPEHFNAVWVKNEWSRFLALTQNDRSRLLIPCYCDMDAYDLPEELSMLQSQDMSKIGFMQDIIRGVKKVLDGHGTAKASSAEQAAGNTKSAGIDSYMKRGVIFLEDAEWAQADEYFDKVLDIDPEYAPAYVGKLCAEFNVHTQSELGEANTPLDTSTHYKNALRFADTPLQSELMKLSEEVRSALIYEEATLFFENKSYGNAEELFRRISGYRDAEEMADQSARLQNEKEERRKKCADMAKRITVFKGNLIINNPDGTITSCIEKNTGAADMDRLAKISRWRGIVAVSGTRGLKADGTVTDVAEWKDIIAISGSFGLKSDGTVVTVTSNNDIRKWVSRWRDIVAISGGEDYVAGLQSDGTIIVLRPGGMDGRYTDLQDVIAIKLTQWHLIALKSDGTVFASDFHVKGSVNAFMELKGLEKQNAKYVEKDKNDTPTYTFELNVSGWSDIIAIGGERNIAFGIKSDGAIVLANSSRYYESELRPQALAMHDIIAAEISTLGAKTILFGIQSDGTPIVLREYLPLFQMRTPQDFEKERKQREEWARKGLCTKCGGKLSGLFTKTCQSCGKENDGGLLDRMEGFIDRIGEGI